MRHEDLHEQAAHWFLRLREADIDADEIEAALSWLAESPEHQAAYDAVERVWAGSVPATAEPSPMRQVEPAATRRFIPTRAWRVAAMMLVLAGLAAGVRLSSHWEETPVPVRYASVVGETRNITLADGSTVLLGAASSISVEYAAQMRRVVLTDGEALFTVAKNPARPFIVEAAGGSAQALGTVFNVHRGPEGVTVGVAEGVVQVKATSSPSAPAVRLPAGTEVTYTALAELGAVRNVRAERVGGWQRGVLSFIDRPLGAVVADLNRYSKRLIVIDDEALKQVHVSGSVTTAGIEEWLRALQDTTLIELRESDRALTLRKPPSQARR